ncbi:MAG: YbjQ family protein [Bacteroidota bacterium]
MKELIIVNTPDVPGRTISKALGMARGSTTRARFIGRDFIAGLKMIAGGEISEYTKLLKMAREQALERMIEDAGEMGADAIVNVRITTATIMSGASEILAYGTAVTLTDG